MNRGISAKIAQRLSQKAQEADHIGANVTSVMTVSPDNRINALDQSFAMPRDVEKALHDVLGETIASTLVSDFTRHRSKIITHWNSAGTAFLNVGNELLALDKKLGEAQKRRLIRETGRLFPFSSQIASMLRQTARAVQDGRVEDSELPGSYATAYVIATMTDDEISRGRIEKIIGPAVSRPALVLWLNKSRGVEVGSRKMRKQVPKDEDAQLAPGLIDLVKLTRRRNEIIEELEVLDKILGPRV